MEPPYTKRLSKDYKPFDHKIKYWAMSPILHKGAIRLVAPASESSLRAISLIFKRWRLDYKPLPSKILDEAISLKLHNIVIGLLAPSF